MLALVAHQLGPVADKEATGSSNYNYIDRIRDDPSRTLMGSRQETWFYNSLRESQDRGARWRIVGNQIVFSRIFDNDKGEMSGDDWNVGVPAIDLEGGLANSADDRATLLIVIAL